MKLYSFTGSCGLVSHIVLEWIGQPYELEMLTKEQLKSPEFLALNPNGQVPLLVDGGWALNENAAILNYLADTHPDSQVGGDGSAKSRAEVNRWLALLNSDVHPTFKPLFGATAYLADDAVIAKTQDNARAILRKYYERLDAQLAGKKWLTGTRSLADAYLFVTLLWTHFVQVDLSGLANLSAFEQRMRADKGVQAALKAQHLG